MEMTTINWGVFLLTLGLTPVVLTGAVQAEGDGIHLQRAVQAMLGFKNLPSGDTPKPGKAPKYMLDLYEKYRSGMYPRKSGNTVRSIMAEMGVIEDKQMFLFNLSAIHSSEKVFGGELHVYKKRMKSKEGSDGDVILQLYEISPAYVTQTDTVTMKQQSHGWQSHDILTPLTSCLSTGRRRPPNILGISAFMRKSNGKLGKVPLRRFVHHLSQPFVTVFSNDTQNITLDHIDPHFHTNDLKRNIIDPESGHADMKGFGERSKKGSASSSSPKTYSEAHTRTKQLQVEDTFLKRKRRRRSIYDNEIPDHPMEPIRTPVEYNLPQTNPDILQARPRTKVSDSKLIPYPEEYKTTKRRRKNRRNRKRGNRKLPFLEDWEKPENAAPSWGNKQMCGKHGLIVDFADIGWSEWIISPKSFEANYCAGSCPFPMTRGLKPSNHATIQSLVRAIGIHADVPSPCCVPDSLSSVTLLYFDESRNVVLKNYPQMTAQNCACR